MSFVTDKKNFTDHSEAQTKAADELYKKGITGHASSDIKDYEVAVFDLEISQPMFFFQPNKQVN